MGFVTFIATAYFVFHNTQEGWTALHTAARRGNVAIVCLLIEAHAVINLQSKVHVNVLTKCYNTSKYLLYLVPKNQEPAIYIYIYISAHVVH